MPLVNGKIIDALAAGNSGVVARWLVVAASLTTLFVAANLAHGLLALRVTEEVGQGLRVAATKAVITRPLYLLDRTALGDVVTRTVGDSSILKGAATGLFLQSGFDVISVLGATVLLCYIHPVLSLLLIALVPLSLVARLLTAEPVAAAQLASRGAASRLATHLCVWVASLREIVSFQIEHAASDRLTIESLGVKNAAIRAGTVVANIQAFSTFALQLPVLGVLAYGSILVARSELTVGSLAAFLGYASYFQVPLQRLSGAWLTGLPALRPVCERLSELVDDSGARSVLPVMDRWIDQRGISRQPIGRIAFDEVSVAWPSGFVVTSAPFTIAFGDLIALTGPNGCGKTSLLTAFVGLNGAGTAEVWWPPNQRIVIAGGELRSLSAYASKDVRLLPGTLRENATMFAAEPDQARLDEQAHYTGLLRTVSRLTNGWDTPIDATLAAKFSQGELRQVALTRAMYRRAPLLVLDEPTDSLDAEVRQHFLQTMSAWRSTRAVIIATHDEDVLARCTRVIAVAGGVRRFDVMHEGVAP